jgi:hypothetical protein
MLRVGDTLVPLIFMSDGTHLLNVAGDKKEWLVYMTIGNLSLKMRQMASTQRVVMVALQPIAIKNRNILQKWVEEQRQTNREVQNEVLPRLLQLLTFKHNPCAKSGYFNVLCADGNFRLCEPDLAAWLAHCPEYSDLHHVKRHVFIWCECSRNELEDYVPPDMQHPRPDHNLYRTLRNANTKAAGAELSERHVHRGFIVVRHILCIVSNVPEPDLLHSMQIGMLDHLQAWIFEFMKTHERLDKYNTICLSVPAYHNLTSKNKSYEEVSQWNEKKMKEMSC